MTKVLNIAAFGALNKESYDAFDHWLEHYAGKHGLHYVLYRAGPYPNAQAVTQPGRPLRGDALKSDALKQELLLAVADDAKSLSDDIDVYCMPCLSMVGFHDGVEDKLGSPIFRMADALKTFYASINKLGVIHMRPATKRIDEIFGDKAIRPSAEYQAQLLDAEEQLKQTGNTAQIEAIMADITQTFQSDGVSHVLYARADAPLAQQHIDATNFPNIEINSYFQILAKDIISQFE